MAEVARAEFRSMGTTVSLIGPAGADAFDDAANVARAVFDREDRRFSRFRAESELSSVNRRAGRWTVVTAEFAAVVRLAVQAWKDTAGRFDPTVLDAVVAAGYDRDFDDVLAGARAAVRPTRPGGRVDEIRLDGDRIRLPDGTGLDLGGIAKGWTVDLAAEMAVGCGLPWALVNAGGDLRLAGSAPPGAIDVGLEDPQGPRLLPGRVILDGGALATSSVTRRAWGDGLHHVIDPATGRPAVGATLQATAWAPTCAEAEVRATHALLEGPSFLERETALLCLADGRILSNLRTAGVAA